MDFEDDDIGNFGLLPPNRNAGKKKRIKTSSAAFLSEKVAQKHKKNDMNHGRRNNGAKKSYSEHAVRNDGIDSDCSSDDDNIALSDLVKRQPSQKAAGTGKQSRRAVTPASLLNNELQQQSRSKNKRSEARGNDNNDNGPVEGQQSKKVKKQIGIHSFLQDKRQNSSFVSASSMMLSGHDNEEEMMAKNDSSPMLQNNFNEEQEAVSNNVAASSEDSIVDEIDEVDNDTEEPANSNASSTNNEVGSSKQPWRFGIHSLILGHGLPIMHPEEYYRASTTSVTLPTSTDTVVNQRVGATQQTNNHINRNILSHILQRTYCTRPSTSSSSVLRRYTHSNVNSTENVQLSSSSNNDNNSEAVAMAFDTMGILLAVGDNHGKINIFDFDEVYAADLKKRNEWSRHSYEYQDAASKARCYDIHDDDDGTISTDAVDVDNGKKEEEAGSEIEGDDRPIPPLPSTKVNPVHSFQCQFIQGNATRNNNYLNSANRPRISGIYWNPDNQNHIAVSFENKAEIHLYDVASSTVPPPCLRVGDSNSSRGGNVMGSHQQRCEGVITMRFIRNADKGCGEVSTSGWTDGTRIITGGRYGTVRLWSIPSTKQPGKRRRRCCISELNAKCVWSIPVFGSNGDSVSDMLILPAQTSTTPAGSSKPSAKPLVLLSGGSSSALVLLDTNKCTRKAFSTSITPTVAASWNLHQLASRELAKIDAKARLPDRRWMSARNMRLIEYRKLSEEGGFWWCKVVIVTNSGWVFVAELSSSNYVPRLSVHIVHHTPRIQCFNSSKERLTVLGGIALKYSLPNAPVPSSDCVRMMSSDMVWLADVKGKKYTMPAKEKYVLCEDYDSLEVLQHEMGAPGTISDSSSESGVILVSLDASSQYTSDSLTSRNIVTRLPLPLNGGAPLALATHPSGDWMVVGCGKESSPLKLIRLSKAHPRM